VLKRDIKHQLTSLQSVGKIAWRLVDNVVGVWMSDACGCVQRLRTSVGVLAWPRCYHQFSRQRRLAASSLRCLLGTGIMQLSLCRQLLC